MGNFIVSARKYRPETFNTVVGQTSITSTLKNAIKSSHLGHAYLFCGPRGVGKTTCARIFAKTINCSNPAADSEPCNKCESCLSFNENRSYNIHELDAASNNSVEDIRLLTEKVRIPPQLGKYSVYIIDEVHMLSQAAFNAFLKTLEEPPAHAVFILATTEKHKIIPTILSRCQIFDFNRIRLDDAVKYLKYICGEENIKCEGEALHVIAQKADGAMRDALSIFDQVVSFSGTDITYRNVIENLNILDTEYYFRVVDFCLAGDLSSTLLCFDEILGKGFDAKHFINGLASHFRNLMVSKNPETLRLLEVTDSHRKKYLEQSQACDAESLFQSLEACNEADVQYKASSNQRLLIELSLWRIINAFVLKKKSLKEDKTPDTADEEIKSNVPPPVNPVVHHTRPAEVSRHFPDKAPADRASISDKVIIEDKHIRKNMVSEMNISISGAISMKPSKEKTNDSEQEIDEEIIVEPEASIEKDFTSDELEIKWKVFADQLQSDRPRIAVSLKRRKPELRKGFVVEFSFENNDLMDDFNTNFRSQLITFLKKELLNNSVTLRLTVDEAGSISKKMIYTPEEKFQYLARKNPLLEKLKQQFNMELE